jgi:hypothetical protein
VDLRLDAGRLEGSVTAHVVDLAHEIGLATPDSLCSPAWVQSHIGSLHAAIDKLLRVEADGTAVRPLWVSFQNVAGRKLVAFRWNAPHSRQPGVLCVRGPLFAYDPAHETYVNIYVDGAVRKQDLLDRTHLQTVFSTGVAPPQAWVVRTFLLEGMRRVFLGPEHVLFLVGMLLACGGLRRLMPVAASFTVAHILAQVLTTLGVVSPPARLVAAATALSIVYVGADNLLPGTSGRAGRVLAAFGFGLVHGLGFASAMRAAGVPAGAITLSFTSFNVGIVVGQACAVLAATGLLAVLRARRPSHAEQAASFGSALVLAAGAFWFVQRAFFA